MIWFQNVIKQLINIFYKKALFRNFVIFTGKHSCSSLFLIKLQPVKRNTAVNTAKFLRTHILKNSCKRLLLMATMSPSWYNVINNIQRIIPVGYYLFKFNKRNTTSRGEICSKLTKRRQWSLCGVFFVNSEHISHLVLVFQLLYLSR